jgi:hypothetical protein
MNIAPHYLSPYGRINNATNVLAVAMCLHQAVRNGKVTVDMIEPLLKIVDSAGGQFELRPAYTQEGLETLSYNLITAALCIASIQVDVALTALQKADPKLGPDFDDLRDLFYMLRCALAHEPASPKWEIRKQKYRRVVEVKALRLRVDFVQLEGKPFDPSHMGGMPGMLHLLEHARRVVAKIDHQNAAAHGPSHTV